MRLPEQFRDRRRAGARVALIAIALAFAAAACSSVDEGGDAQERAKRINTLLKEADKVLPALQEAFAKAGEDGVDPDDWFKRLAKAEQQAEEAKKLSLDSHRPRQTLSNVLYFTGQLYTLKADNLQREIAAYEARKETPPARLVRDREAADVERRKYFKRCIQELNFYISHMANQNPAWERNAWDMLNGSYVAIEDWQNAANTLRDFMRVFQGKLTPEAITHYKNQIRRYETNALDAAE
ncbi:MAG: hypothetical protein L0Z55_01365 [Planctomycetes bacterium]|nr:hypothetical protein [Planctomycetota bacterium]